MANSLARSRNFMLSSYFHQIQGLQLPSLIKFKFRFFVEGSLIRIEGCYEITIFCRMVQQTIMKIDLKSISETKRKF